MALGRIREEFNFDRAVRYHYGKFPPSDIDYGRLAKNISTTAAALARYDGVIRSLSNSDLLLAPLRRQEAVISSRIEGTVATLDEVLKYEAEEEQNPLQGAHARAEVVEVFSYTRALNHAQQLMNEGLPICSRLMRSTHSRMLFFGRGADKMPGEFKSEQNYIIDGRSRNVLFIPISAGSLAEGLTTFEKFSNDDTLEPLVQTALAHLEFESLHPFKDGNGRVGRMLITLMLWNKGLISAPHFYISGYLEDNRDEYLDRLRAASESGEWTEWCLFFLRAIEKQAQQNLETAEKIHLLYEEMKERFRLALRSQFSTVVLDYVFAKPVFRASGLLANGELTRATITRCFRLLTDEKLVSVVTQGSGRRASLYAFEPLLNLVRT